MNATEKRITLRKLLATDECFPSPCAFDAMTAIITEQAGYKIASLGSYGTAISHFGLPDNGLVTLTELANHVRMISDVISIPLMCDAEKGFYDVSGIWRTVREFENAGASSIFFEDIEIGKHSTKQKKLFDADVVGDKIKAACDARQDHNMMILGRTDAIWAFGDISLAVERANHYIEAGADAILLTYMDGQCTPEDIGKIRHLIPAPIVVTGTSTASLAREKAAGINVVGYWQMLVYAAYKACKDILEGFNKTRDYGKMGDYRYDEGRINELFKRHKTLYENLEKPEDL